MIPKGKAWGKGVEYMHQSGRRKSLNYLYARSLVLDLNLIHPLFCWQGEDQGKDRTIRLQRRLFHFWILDNLGSVVRVWFKEEF